jgi:hypothetical protein
VGTDMKWCRARCQHYRDNTTRSRSRNRRRRFDGTKFDSQDAAAASPFFHSPSTVQNCIRTTPLSPSLTRPTLPSPQRENRPPYPFSSTKSGLVASYSLCHFPTHSLSCLLTRHRFSRVATAWHSYAPVRSLFVDSNLPHFASPYHLLIHTPCLAPTPSPSHPFTPNVAATASRLPTAPTSPPLLFPHRLLAFALAAAFSQHFTSL